MKSGKKDRSARVTLIMFLAAAVLLAMSSVGGARAAMIYNSDDYRSQLGTQEIGVALMEKSAHDSAAKETEGDGLLGGLLEEGEAIKPGKEYTEELSVRNTGSISQYVRVTIHKYWWTGTAEQKEKRQNLNPAYIRLNLVNTGDWLEDPAASTKERTVLYYNRVLEAGAYTPLFADKLTIDGGIATKVTQKTEGGVMTTVYNYKGAKFAVEVQVDAVQEHNAQDAALSAWGREVTVADGVLSLK